jgi:hypothetical protein
MFINDNKNTTTKPNYSQVKKLHGRKSYLRNMYLSNKKIDKVEIMTLFGNFENFVSSCKRKQVYTQKGGIRGLFQESLDLIKDIYPDEFDCINNCEPILSDKERKEVLNRLKRRKDLDVLAQKYESNGFITSCLTLQDCEDRLEGLLRADENIKNTINKLTIEIINTTKTNFLNHFSYWQAVGEQNINKILYVLE